MMDQRVQEVFGGIRVIHLIAVSSKLPFKCIGLVLLVNLKRFIITVILLKQPDLNRGHHK